MLGDISYYIHMDILNIPVMYCMFLCIFLSHFLVDLLQLMTVLAEKHNPLLFFLFDKPRH